MCLICYTTLVHFPGGGVTLCNCYTSKAERRDIIYICLPRYKIMTEHNFEFIEPKDRKERQGAKRPPEHLSWQFCYPLSSATKLLFRQHIPPQSAGDQSTPRLAVSYFNELDTESRGLVVNAPLLLLGTKREKSTKTCLISAFHFPAIANSSSGLLLDNIASLSRIRFIGIVVSTCLACYLLFT